MPNITDKERGIHNTDWKETGRVGDVSNGRQFKHVQIPPFASRWASNASVSIYGFARPGTNASLPQWRLMRENHAGTFLDFPDGKDTFEYSWDQRESYVYL